jgi:hypothetical protein
MLVEVLTVALGWVFKKCKRLGRVDVDSIMLVEVLTVALGCT